MTNTLSPWLEKFFPEVDGPYTMTRIVERLREYHTPTISRSATYRALRALQRSKVTASDVTPVDVDGHTCFYDALAARRIAQRVTRDRPPKLKKI